MICRILFVVLSFFVLVSACRQQDTTDKGVRLVEWKPFACDNTYDPYRLINRISEKRVEGALTFLTVNFHDNCCAELHPEISYKDNQLFILPYKKDLEALCDCDCCFSIEFKIEGLPDNYETFFNGEKIEVSNDHYQVFKPTSTLYKGDTINKTNRYGFKEGAWMEFYETGRIKMQAQYPVSELYYEPRPIWEKNFYPSGKLASFDRKDTLENWFENGEIKSRFIEYKVGDTTYEMNFQRYDNHRVEERSLRKSYPYTYRSEFDPEYKSEGSRNDIVYLDEFFENGQAKFKFGKDTTFSWYASGKIEWLRFQDQEIKYNEDGSIIEKEFHWVTKGRPKTGDIDHSLYATLNRAGKVIKIQYVRNEQSSDGSTTQGVRYYWSWNEKGTLIESPKKWDEPLPWKKFDLPMYSD